ncbi:twin-arginine translocation signal domain-containing protein [Herminiimonas sp. NPDC097707]|uniref:twin-arginine translocation signal domain-containing protein n=1 Tax=Herminiimonas sp. NPDC097707 TaxID=3364007 RepID=UPI00383A0091
MDVKRRDFVKGCGAAACVLLLPVGASASTIAAKGKKANNTSAADLRIEKSIKANFGGGFTVRSHTQSGALTRAEIENFGNRYAVTSANMLDWKIVSSSLNN